METKDTNVSLGLAIAKSVFAAAGTTIPGLGTALSIASSATEIAGAINGSDSDRKTTKRLNRAVEDIVDNLDHRIEAWDQAYSPVDRAGRTIGSIERKLASDVVIAAVSNEVIDLVGLASTGFDSRTIVTTLLPTCRTEWTKLKLAANAVEYGERLLGVTAQMLAAYHRPVLNSDRDLSLRALLSSEKVAERFESVLSDQILPSYRYPSHAEKEEFESAYRTAITTRFSSTEQFGLQDVPEALRTQPIESTFVSLRTSAVLGQRILEEFTRRRPDYWLTHQPLSDSYSIEELLAVLNRNKLRTKVGIRLAIIGAAGSGKTTVARWLVTRCAKSYHDESIMPAEMRDWAGTVPFIVNLRSAFRDRPIHSKPEEVLLSAVAGQVGLGPGGWLLEALNNHPALVVFDGVDELPAQKRADGWDWIGGVARRFPKAHIVVTSRIEAVSPKWLRDNQFACVELSPLSVNQVTLCVSRWFDAVCVTGSKYVPAYRRQQAQLTEQLETFSSLRTIAQTPLMTAILCAYYAAADSSQRGPVSASDLMRRVVALMVDLRDRERGTIPKELIHFDLAAKLRVLGDLALEMFRKGLSIASIGTTNALESASLRRSISSSLNGTTLADLEEGSLERYLLQRASVLLDLGNGEVQFSHRVVLEYLAAFRLVQIGEPPSPSSIMSPGWASVCTFFCGYAPEYLSTALLNDLFEAVESEDMDSARRRLIFCLASCLGVLEFHLTGRDATVGKLLSEVMPPVSEEEIQLLSAVGPAVLPPLLVPSSVGEARLYIRASCKVGGEAGLALLEEYAGGQFGGELHDALLDAWPYFNAEEYAQRVINQFLTEKDIVPVRTRDCLSALSICARVESVKLFDVGGLDDLQDFRECTNLRVVDISESGLIARLDGIDHLVELRRLALPKSGSISTLNPLASLRVLAELHIFNGSSLTSITPIANLEGLKKLSLGNCPQGIIDQLKAGFKALEFLLIDGGQGGDIEPMSGLDRLKRLRLVTGMGVRNSSPLTRLRELEALELRLAATRPELQLPTFGALRRLELSGWVATTDLHAIGQPRYAVFLDGIRSLRLPSGVDGLTSLEDLPPMPNLMRLELAVGSGVLGSLKGLARFPNLRNLHIKGGSFAALAGVTTEWVGSASIEGNPSVKVLDTRTRKEVRREPSDGRFVREGRYIEVSIIESLIETDSFSVLECGNLEKIVFADCPNLASVAILRRLSHLKRLDLSGEMMVEDVDDLRIERPDLAIVYESAWNPNETVAS